MKTNYTLEDLTIGKRLYHKDGTIWLVDSAPKGGIYNYVFVIRELDGLGYDYVTLSHINRIFMSEISVYTRRLFHNV